MTSKKALEGCGLIPGTSNPEHQEEYNWETARYAIGGVFSNPDTEQEVSDAIRAFSDQRYVSGGLLCYYISGKVYQTQQGSLSICGHSPREDDDADFPSLSWLGFEHLVVESLRQTHQGLVILDGCSPSIAYLDPGGFELISASYWQPARGLPPPAMFLQALMETFRLDGFQTLTAIQLASLLYNRDAVEFNKATPVYKSRLGLRNSALIHRMQPGPVMVRRGWYESRLPCAIVEVKVREIQCKFSSEHLKTNSLKIWERNTIPTSNWWDSWFIGDMPEYNGWMKIIAVFGLRTSAFLVQLPLELWLGLNEKPGYTFASVVFPEDSFDGVIDSQRW
ncbi:hypothetical protein CP533_5630 [Ophiocordyceps camponoti-saundersi (nom. inval.)]|nr:hypothetical protein CP533_5630 [Ophiocordyceps camponoti-saundersi (nom. inval.)]